MGGGGRNTNMQTRLKSHKVVFISEDYLAGTKRVSIIRTKSWSLFYDNPKSNSKVSQAFWQSNQGNANIPLLQKYVTPAGLYVAYKQNSHYHITPNNTYYTYLFLIQTHNAIFFVRREI